MCGLVLAAGGVECWADTVAECAGVGVHMALAERALLFISKY
jgi:hypothetical protein